MANVGTLTLTGESGKKYEFTVYGMGTAFISVAAVYAVTKRVKDSDDSYTHSTIYIGETSDLKEQFENHHKQDCFDEKKANCVCVHPDDSQLSRLEKESDLLKNYSCPCYG